MSLNFPNRFVWLFVGIIVFIMLQSGCAPIQVPTDGQPTTVADEAARANLSTNRSDEFTSPNGEWIATTLFQVPRASDEYYQSLVLTHASGSPSYTLVDGWLPMGLGYTVVTPLTWSQDGARFYYTNRAQVDGCGILYNGSDLYQVDLASGETVEILPADTTSKLALSPNEQRVAYLAVGKPTLVIQDIQSGETVSFDLTPIVGEGDQTGAFIWSPDSTQLALAIAHNPCIGGWAEATSIYTLDTATMSLTPHLEKDDRLLVPVAWSSEEMLFVENQVPFDQIENQRQYSFDLTTNTVTQ